MRRTRTKARTNDYRAIRKKILAAGDLPPEIQVVLYGKAGTGKTTLAATFPKPVLFIDCSEKGTDSVRDVEEVDVLRAESWEDVDHAYWFLKKDDHNYKTVVVDTMSQAQDLRIQKVMEDKGKSISVGSEGQWGSMARKDWGTVSAALKSFIISMRDLPNVNVIFVAHDRVFGGEEEEDESVIAPSVGPRLMPSVATTLNGAVSIIGNTFIRETVSKKRVGKRVREERKIEYCLRIGPNAYYVTKIRKPRRRQLPDVIADPSYDSLLSFIVDEGAPTTRRQRNGTTPQRKTRKRRQR